MAAAALIPFTPWLATAGIGWLYYRRIRRQFGRQDYRPRRNVLRIVLLALLACGLLYAAVAIPHVASGLAIGALAGAALGAFALRHTRIGVVEGVREYTPNPWIGAALALLLVGRLAWRWHDGAFAGGSAQVGQQASPLTFAFMGVLVTYYLVQGIGLLQRMRALSTAAESTEPRSAPPQSRN